jgi:hypothetical protein
MEYGQLRANVLNVTIQAYHAKSGYEMLIVLPMHLFIMFPTLFLISNASKHLRSSSWLMLACGGAEESQKH